MKVDKRRAAKILEEEAGKVLRNVPGDPAWAERVRHLSDACDGASKTQIAALGTAILSKATNPRIDPFSLKASDGRRGYSARAVAKDVLAALSVRLEIDLGVSGREPLNNQPFFGEARITADLPWKVNARPAAKILLDSLRELDKVKTEKDARAALRAFLVARKKKAYVVALGDQAGDDISYGDLIEKIARFVRDNGERGKRAQAVVAGLLDVQSGPARVMVAQIHDPDRRFPCDVGVRFADQPKALERTFEVRDKPVPESDIFHIVNKCISAGVTKVGVVAVSGAQALFDLKVVQEWAWKQGVVLGIFVGWREFVHYALFSSPLPGDATVGAAFRAIFERLKQLEVSRAGIDAWKAQSKI